MNNMYNNSHNNIKLNIANTKAVFNFLINSYGAIS